LLLLSTHIQRDRYWRQKVMQWQKSNGSIQFDVRNLRYDRMGNRISMDSNGSLNAVNGGGRATGTRRMPTTN
jgi:hypothetical protein